MVIRECPDQRSPKESTRFCLLDDHVSGFWGNTLYDRLSVGWSLEASTILVTPTTFVLLSEFCRAIRVEDPDACASGRSEDSPYMRDLPPSRLSTRVCVVLDSLEGRWVFSPDEAVCHINHKQSRIQAQVQTAPVSRRPRTIPNLGWE